MPDEKEKAEVKVTDRRMFTADGNIREEFKQEIEPAEPPVQAEAEPSVQAEARPQPKSGRPATERRTSDKGAPPDTGERRRTMAEKARSPETHFTNFIEPLIAQAYMSLGMLKNPYQPQAEIDMEAARQMIDILHVLQEKTAGNLTREEDDFLQTHINELKLAYVQRTKTL